MGHPVFLNMVVNSASDYKLVLAGEIVQFGRNLGFRATRGVVGLAGGYISGAILLPLGPIGSSTSYFIGSLVANQAFLMVSSYVGIKVENFSEQLAAAEIEPDPSMSLEELEEAVAAANRLLY